MIYDDETPDVFRVTVHDEDGTIDSRDVERDDLPGMQRSMADMLQLPGDRITYRPADDGLVDVEWLTA